MCLERLRRRGKARCVKGVPVSRSHRDVRFVFNLIAKGCLKIVCVNEALGEIIKLIFIIYYNIFNINSIFCIVIYW